jgi:DMSO/TMAO reductase YedYZ molybdopterin-dependent catalytic subunit
MNSGKTQGNETPTAQGLPEDVIISPDARRVQRIPPGQSRTLKWPVLDASGPPSIDAERWRLRIFGLVGKEVEWDGKIFSRCPACASSPISIA